MAHHKSAIKRIQIGERNRLRNRHYKSQLKTKLGKVRVSTDKEEAQTLYRSAVSLLDKLVVKGIIHKNKAANQKSKLAQHIEKL